MTGAAPVSSHREGGAATAAEAAVALQYLPTSTIDIALSTVSVGY